MSEQTSVAATTTRPQASEILEAKIREFEELDNQVNTLTEQLRDLKQRRKDVSETDITNLATEEDVLHCGVMLADGTEYRFERDYKCGIDKKDQPVAFDWLTKRNLGHLLKHYITLEFPADSVESAKKIKALIYQLLPQYEIRVIAGDEPTETLAGALTSILTAADLAPVVKVTTEQGVAGATLSKFVKKCINAGITLPLEFGAYTPLRAIRVPKPVAPAPADAEGATEPQVATS
jgi:hypothetical protein